MSRGSGKESTHTQNRGKPQEYTQCQLLRVKFPGRQAYRINDRIWCYPVGEKTQYKMWGWIDLSAPYAGADIGKKKSSMVG